MLPVRLRLFRKAGRVPVRKLPPDVPLRAAAALPDRQRAALHKDRHPRPDIHLPRAQAEPYCAPALRQPCRARPQRLAQPEGHRPRRRLRQKTTDGILSSNGAGKSAFAAQYAYRSPRVAAPSSLNTATSTSTPCRQRLTPAPRHAIMVAVDGYPATVLKAV